MKAILFYINWFCIFTMQNLFHWHWVFFLLVGLSHIDCILSLPKRKIYAKRLQTKWVIFQPHRKRSKWEYSVLCPIKYSADDVEFEYWCCMCLLLYSKLLWFMFFTCSLLGFYVEYNQTLMEWECLKSDANTNDAPVHAHIYYHIHFTNFTKLHSMKQPVRTGQFYL